MNHDNQEHKALERAVRMSFRDSGMMTFDSATTFMDQGTAVHPGKPLGYGAGAVRGVRTHDGRTVDSTGAFFVGELERLDQTLHGPLKSVTYARDIDMREDVTIADEVTSFTLSTFASASGIGDGAGIGQGIAWIGKATDQIQGVGVDLAKVVNPLTAWGIEVKYTVLELESAAKIGRPIDQQKFEAMNVKHEMDIDQMVYVGSAGGPGVLGLTNHQLVTNINNVATGVGGITWAKKTPAEILTDFNSAITSVWAASAWAVAPSHVLLPPAQYGALSTALISLAGSDSVLNYIKRNNIYTTQTGQELQIYPSKWCVGGGAGGVRGTPGIDRIVVYTKDPMYLRYPMTLLARTPVQYQSLYHATTYYCKLGCVEVLYPETIGYFDGI